MLRPPTLKINEIFSSLQGEGLRQGEPTLFIRLTGCNLRCAFCDTSFAWEMGEDLLVEQILDRARDLRRDFPSEWVCLTGGEPLLQDLGELLKALTRASLKIQVETNATQPPMFPVDWYTASPKPPDYDLHPGLAEVSREVKLVLSHDLTEDVCLRLCRSFPAETPLILQPESNQDWSVQKGLDLLRKVLASGKTNVRLSLQLHKILDIP
jgi:organic radical activating enzyme